MSDKQTPILSVDVKKYYSNTSDGIEYTARVCVDMKAIQRGLIQKLGANKFALLMAIVAHMDEQGKCFPSQRQLSKLTGQSPTTVNKLINELLNTEVDGQKLLRRELVGDSKRKKSIYYIHNGKVTESDDVEKTVKETEEKENKKPMNARDIAHYFLAVYQDTFGYGYNISYEREVPLIKNKLMKNFDEETIKGIIDIAVKQYKDKWYKPQYPTPSIYMICGWLGNEANKIYQEEKKQKALLEERKQKAMEQDQTDKALELFEKLF